MVHSMKTEIIVTVRAYPVEIRDERTGERKQDTIVLTKQRLQAIASIRMGDKELINRVYNRQGFHVMDVGDPVKADLTVDLLKLFKWQSAGQEVAAGD